VAAEAARRRARDAAVSLAHVVGALVDAGRVPEPALRAAIRAVCALRLRQEARRADRAALLASLEAAPIAIETAAANAQHYEVPAAFYQLVLGPHLKYSGAYWPAGVETLGEAEAAMLDLTAARAELADGQRVLDLGCGWGSFALWAAARYPRSRITAVSNSHSQHAFITAAARAAGLRNLEVVTADVTALAFPAAAFDRVVSIEMFEHVRNHRALLARLAHWLAPAGRLFVHVFAHRRWTYPFSDDDATDWMARSFFTGGVMPSADLLPSLVQHDDALSLLAHWHLAGTHYARTAEAWHTNLLAHRTEATAILGSPHHFHRWRVFFLACAELFAFRSGTEWSVRHYLIAR
jgi:cyclopropane-fatty-acyl-phospholipid synthase